MAIFPAFGHNPSGNELEKVDRSANCSDRVFHNLNPTDSLIKGVSFPRIMWRFLNKPSNTVPPKALPTVKTNLASLQEGPPAIVWFGHSSYLICINDVNILVDPVFSGHASPFSFTAKSFKGSDIYSVGDMPRVDILLLTHDHYDHLDYKTVRRLAPTAKYVCTSLGVGSHLAYWGVDKNLVTELDWWEAQRFSFDKKQEVEITAAPARHFSGRTFNRNRTLWSSFILRCGDYKIYVGGDSGYDAHFKTIGAEFGPFDIALLECGQYNEWWPFIHMMPEETVQAAIDARARVLMPVHWGKFSLSVHPWDEPIKRLVAKAKELNVPVATPMIGEPVFIGKDVPSKAWWLEW